jgi:hypothetical protein
MPGHFLSLVVFPEWITPLAIALVFLVVAGPMWLVFRWYIKPATAEERKDAITLLFQTLGGAAFLLGVYFTWQQLIISRAELKVSQEGQITERYTRAIDQLGKADSEPKTDAKGVVSAGEDNLAIRLGGIYALERIARESKPEASGVSDHSTIMDVLTAFVRQRALWKGENQNGSGTIVKPDIQAILTVIGRRAFTFGKGETQPLDLSATDLRGATLTDANLDGVILRSAHFEGGTTNLTRVHLIKATLQDARFAGAIMTGAKLIGANLVGADLRGAMMEGVDFTGADLGGADLRGAIGLKPEQISVAKTNESTLTDFNTVKKP